MAVVRSAIISGPLSLSLIGTVVAFLPVNGFVNVSWNVPVPPR